MILLLVLCATCTAVVGSWVLASRAKSKLPCPPGPKGLPFIGNAFDIDPHKPQITYAQWGKTYGDLIYIRTFGQDIVVVNSEKTARLLADGRSEIYSDHYRSPIFRVYGTYRMTFVLEYGKEWKAHRKLFHLSLRSDVVSKYNDLYLNHARKLLENVLHDGTSLFKHFDLYAGSILVELIYGRRVEGKDDPVLAMASGLAAFLCKEVTADRAGLLKIMPFVQYLPSWFPGAGFKRKAAQCRKMVVDMTEVPFAMAKDEMASHWLLRKTFTDFMQNRGALSHCMVSDVLKHGEVEEASTATVLKTIALIMTLYPDVQDRVHAELDTVVERGALPTFADRPRLPYLQAVLYEVMRWNPPAPLGLPHVTSASDIYEGYYIPEGALLFFNRAMKDDGYNNPERFDPTRHLTSDGRLSPQAKQNNSIFFGFGKRLCPGRFFADHALWAATAVMLSSVKFGRAKDLSGKYMDVEPVFSSGLVR
ncbi:cytochrome P450 [Pisolithus marmoratus]|nr:cytochrome P450 [Pisolithus marmoratus]